jgi:ABC-type glycerol-3-phosphate transport system substrate-binding protein
MEWEEMASLSARISRRGALQLGAGAAALPLVHMRTARAAGRLAVGFWDHWVPEGNEVMRRQVNAWAAANKVDVALDFISSSGNKLLVTISAEAQAGTGHDILPFPVWEVPNHAAKLVAVDDVVARLEAKYGKLDPYYAYFARIGGHWLAVPTSSGTQYKGPVGRIDLLQKHCGLDPRAMYPARPEPTALADQWTYETFLRCAAECAKAGKPFGIGLGTTGDSVDTVGSILRAFGVELVDAKGNITVKSDNTRHMLEYMKQFVPHLPPNVYSFDDATDNRMLIADQTALIYNPPSAWAVARRDAPKVAEQCWHFSPTPMGPAGRFTPFLAFFWGIWSFSRNQSAAKELIQYLMQREQVKTRCDVVLGYDIPPFDSMLDFDIWEKAAPPPGTIYNYPLRPYHKTQRSVTGMPAPPAVAVQIYNQALPCNMIAKVCQAGQSIDQAIAWAERELESYIG